MSSKKYIKNNEKDLLNLSGNNIGVNYSNQNQLPTRLFRFSSKKSKGDAKRWLDQFIPFITGWSDERKIALFKSYLEGTAYQWFVGAENLDFNDVESFEKEFLSI